MHLYSTRFPIQNHTTTVIMLRTCTSHSSLSKKRHHDGDHALNLPLLPLARSQLRSPSLRPYPKPHHVGGHALTSPCYPQPYPQRRRCRSAHPHGQAAHRHLPLAAMLVITRSGNPDLTSDQTSDQCRMITCGFVPLRLQCVHM